MKNIKIYTTIWAFCALFLAFSCVHAQQGKFFGGDGCGYATVTATVSFSVLAIDDEEPADASTDPRSGLKTEEITFYPLPANQFVTYSNPKDQAFAAKLISLQGVTVKHWPQLNGTEGRLELEGIAPGAYFLKVQQNDRQQVTRIWLQ